MYFCVWCLRHIYLLLLYTLIYMVRYAWCFFSTTKRLFKDQALFFANNIWYYSQNFITAVGGSERVARVPRCRLIIMRHSYVVHRTGVHRFPTWLPIPRCSGCRGAIGRVGIGSKFQISLREFWQFWTKRISAMIHFVRKHETHI